MSDNLSVIPFRFEKFPDEILLEIFKYVEPIDLHCFFGHNQRLNNIIQDVKVSLAIQYPECEDENLNCLGILRPKQFIHLELQSNWDALDICTLTELRSLKINCLCLSECQFDQLLTVNLPYLERLSIENVPNGFVKQLFGAIIDNEHFPSLKVCQFSGEFYQLLEVDEDYQSPNNTIRTLTLNKLVGSQLSLLLNRLPNLHRLETNLIPPINNSLHPIVHHNSLEKLRLTVKDPLNDIMIILPYTPSLKQLRITGKIGEDTVLSYFETLAKILRSEAKDLQQFDCELYFHAWSIQVDVCVIQQLHPLFKKIKCHLGSNINQCYTTDLNEYSLYSEYSHIERTTNYVVTHNWGNMSGYDSDPYDDDRDEDDSNNWYNPMLGYRASYKAEFGSSPWSGNND